MDDVKKRYEDLMEIPKKDLQPPPEDTKSEEIKPSNFNAPKLFNKTIIFESIVAGLIGYVGMSDMFDGILESVSPNMFYYDGRGCRSIKMHGKIIKIAILAIIFMIVKLWILE